VPGNALRFAFAAGPAFRAPALLALALATGSFGCDAILGIHDVQHDPTGSGGTGGATTGPGGGGTGGTSAGPGGGGTGGTTSADFDFGPASPNIDLPLGGQAFLGVQISPKGGFTGDVKIDIKLPPANVTFEGTTLPSGATTGKVKVGATNAAMLGQMFDLTLVATSGAISHEATVHGTVTGTPGTLVEAFGVAGIGSWTLAMDDGHMFDVREVAQNKIVLTGDALPGLASTLSGARMLVGGMMDTTFGPNADGKIGAQFCGCTKHSEGRGVARLINGNVLMIGTGNKGSGFIDDIALLRLKDDGNPEDIGGDKGQALVDLGGKEYTHAMQLTKDEHVIAVGNTDGTGFIAKFDTFGQLDSTFGGGKGFVLAGALGMSEVEALAIDTQGRIVAAAHSNQALVVARLTPDGMPDAAWNGGKAIGYDPAGDQVPVGVAVQTDGKIVVAGYTTEGGTPDVVVIRFGDDGKPDETFGTKGFTVAKLGSGSTKPVGMGVLADGRIIVAGNDPAGPFVARFLADGTVDPTFATNGYASLFLGMNGEIQSMTIGALNRIILAGTRENQPVKGFVAKVWN
jgi:uncharacterized delta-60 repeat protein